MIEGDELALAIGIVSALIPYRWQLGLLQVEPSQKMNFPLHPRLVYKDAHVVAHLWGY